MVMSLFIILHQNHLSLFSIQGHLTLIFLLGLRVAIKEKLINVYCILQLMNLRIIFLARKRQ
ncbi:hypothetical protein EAN81_18040 [Klebsiella pneumoniae]|nr:hypothetical protein EAN81_18040 [Klebsiella pneumoniae]